MNALETSLSNALSAQDKLFQLAKARRPDLFDGPDCEKLYKQLDAELTRAIKLKHRAPAFSAQDAALELIKNAAHLPQELALRARAALDIAIEENAALDQVLDDLVTDDDLVPDDHLAAIERILDDLERGEISGADADAVIALIS